MKPVYNVLKNDLLYVIKPQKYSKAELIALLNKHPEIKFVSLAGVDLTGNTTDEKIPIELFYNNIDEFLNGSIQTDGSSVVLPGIATLNNGKVDLVADINANWFVDYNFENIDPETDKPIGSLRIPAFLVHNNVMVDSRSILKRAIENFQKSLKEILRQYPHLLEEYGIRSEDIDSIIMTSATELEFWVKTPNDEADQEALSATQVLQESYWKRTKGVVRTSMEQALLLMERYKFNPEMGHKEVGGIQARLDNSGNLTHIMEQLEIDWKYDESMQAADNDRFVRTIIKEVFRLNGLEVTFQAKPIDGVAGSGKHTHIGVAAKLNNGKRINLFAPKNMEADYTSAIGYGALMGLLKNYEVINPFISANIDSLNRLKPGFEAPVCIVSSLGHTVHTPSRNRTVLVGLVRDMENPLSTRFEVRSPNPLTNVYLALAALYQSMLDGIRAAAESKKTAKELEADLSKNPGDESIYLEKDRAYRSEEDVFEHFTPEERNKYFGKHPATVYENVCSFDKYPERVEVLKAGEVVSDKIIRSFATAAILRWETEIQNRLIPEYMDFVRICTKLHSAQDEVDDRNWARVNSIRLYLMKDNENSKSLFNHIREVASQEKYAELSELQIELCNKVNELKEAYNIYRRNIID